MGENEYRRLIELVEEQLRDLGLEPLADSSAYVDDDLDADEVRLKSPGDHLVALLRAFGRHLASEDGHVVQLALSDINEVLVEGRVEDAAFDPIRQDDRRESYSLQSSPDLGVLRSELEKVVREIEADLYPGPSLT